MDFCGILTGMGVAGSGFIYFSFYCAPRIILFWVSMLVALYFVVIHWCWTRFTVRLDAKELSPRDRFPEFSFSLSSYVVLASFIPIVLSWIICPEYFKNLTLFWILVDASICPVLLSVGVTVFAQGGVPERFFAGNVFDMLGHSHQLWHLVTATVMFFLMLNIIDFFHARVEHGCG